ncbi:MAG: hypothetical protein AAGC60_08540 [Acidobacteriota bacterium]
MIALVALFVVVLAGLYLVTLALASFFAPRAAARFLDGFAGSARAHVVEMAVRLTVGGALVLAAPRMLYEPAVSAFGWLLVATSLVLLLLPWRWHRAFARTVVPPLTRRVWLFGLFALPLGAALLYAVFAPVSG